MRAGDVVWVDFEIPQGSEPGFGRPSIVITADLVIAANPTTLHVIPITSNMTRRLPTEIDIDIPDHNIRGMAQVHLCSVISRSRVIDSLDEPTNVSAAALSQVRSVLADLLDLP